MISLKKSQINTLLTQTEHDIYILLKCQHVTVSLYGLCVLGSVMLVSQKKRRWCNALVCYVVNEVNCIY